MKLVQVPVDWDQQVAMFTCQCPNDPSNPNDANNTHAPPTPPGVYAALAMHLQQYRASREADEQHIRQLPEPDREAVPERAGECRQSVRHALLGSDQAADGRRLVLRSDAGLSLRLVLPERSGPNPKNRQLLTGRDQADPSMSAARSNPAAICKPWTIWIPGGAVRPGGRVSRHRRSAQQDPFRCAGRRQCGGLRIFRR